MFYPDPAKECGGFARRDMSGKTQWNTGDRVAYVQNAKKIRDKNT